MRGIAEEGIELRPLHAEDAEAFSNAFSAIGWSKPAATFTGYLEEQSQGLRWVRVVEVHGQVAGYVTLRWAASDPELRSWEVPEIMDLNVLPEFRRNGLGTALLDAAEAEAALRGPRVGLRMGLHSGYGAAQRLYVRRGYVPDGAGALSGAEVVAEGAAVRLDDELTLRMIKDLSDVRAEPMNRKGDGLQKLKGDG